jgi:hypothetical protein
LSVEVKSLNCPRKRIVMSGLEGDLGDVLAGTDKCGVYKLSHDIRIVLHFNLYLDILTHVSINTFLFHGVTGSRPPHETKLADS